VDFSFTFPYLNQLHVKASINGTLTTAFTFFSTNVLRFSVAPAAGAVVLIFRETPADTLAAVIQPGGPIPVVGLNQNFLQGLYYNQETQYDAANQSTAGLQAQITAATNTANTANTTAGAANATSAAAQAAATAASSFTQAGAGAVTRSVTSKLQDVVSVKDFGAVGNGSTDDTAAIQAAINSGAKEVRFPYTATSYRITSTLNLTLVQVALVGEAVMGIAPKISGNFNGFLINCAGTALTYNEPYLFKGLSLENLNNGTAAGSAGCIDMRYTGTVAVDQCFLRFQNTGVNCQETISAVFNECFLVGDSTTNPNRTYSRGYYGFGRNCKIKGGRVYGCHVCLDIQGDAWNINGLNCEFSDIIIRQGAANAFLFEGCHFETSGMLFTNAFTLPTVTTSPWTDNGGIGVGWNGSTTFLNCHVSFNAVGGANGQGAPLFVIKDQVSFTGSLILIGCAFVCYTPELATISQSFNRLTATSVPSGLKTVIIGDSLLIDPTTVPDDVYSLYCRFGGSTFGGQAQLNRVKISSLSADIPGNNTYKCTGFTSYIVGTSGQGVNESDTGGGVTLSGYTTSTLRSAFHGQGVRMLYPTLVPTQDNAFTLGSNSLRWASIWAANGTIQTSDIKAKTDIQDSILGLDFINKLSPKRYKMIESGTLTKGETESYVDEDGTTRERIKEGSQKQIPGKRFHEGLIAQEVKETLDELGIDSALWVNSESSQGLRYEELIAPLIKAVQELYTQVQAIQDKKCPN
jgi:hypothetical protein